MKCECDRHLLYPVADMVKNAKRMRLHLEKAKTILQRPHLQQSTTTTAMLNPIPTTVQQLLVLKRIPTAVRQMRIQPLTTPPRRQLRLQLPPPSQNQRQKRNNRHQLLHRCHQQRHRLVVKHLLLITRVLQAVHSQHRPLATILIIPTLRLATAVPLEVTPTN